MDGQLDAFLFRVRVRVSRRYFAAQKRWSASRGSHGFRAMWHLEDALPACYDRDQIGCLASFGDTRTFQIAAFSYTPRERGMSEVGSASTCVDVRCRTDCTGDRAGS